MQERNQGKENTNLGVLILVGLIAALYGTYRLPVQWMEVRIDEEISIAYGMLRDIWLLDWLKSFIDPESVARALKECIANRTMPTENGTLRELEEFEFGVIRTFLTALTVLTQWSIVRGMAMLGAGILFAPAALVFFNLAVRSRQIRSVGVGQSLTPFMQALGIRCLKGSLLVVVCACFVPLVPVQLAVTLGVTWIAFAGFVVGHVQKL